MEVGTRVSGSCLCGDVACETTGPIERMGFCHCSMCRKHHGTANAAFAFTPRETLRWLRGGDRVRGYAASPAWRRTFCGRCGSKTPDPASREPLATLFVGLLDGDPGARPGFHMMVGSKAPWYTISDSIPRHDGFPPESGESIAWPRATEPKDGSIRGACVRRGRVRGRRAVPARDRVLPLSALPKSAAPHTPRTSSPRSTAPRTP
jgi:hypothetical protein